MNKRLRIMKIVAGILILCVLVPDVMLLHGINCNSTDMVVYENHELEYAGADGQFDGDKSSDEHIEESFVTEVGQKQYFNILEIVPDVSMGVFGYTIPGRELLYTGKDEAIREAYLDALVNKTPGANDANSQNVWMNSLLDQISSKMKEGDASNVAAFKFEDGATYDGYYEYVGDNKGAYAIALDKAKNQITDSIESHYLINKTDKTAVMVSKFHSSAMNNTGEFNYIWHYGDSTMAIETSSDYKTIAAKNHKRIKVTNNNKFLRDCYGLNTDSEIDNWRKDHLIQLVTTTPTTINYNQIEKADLIVINSGDNMDYYQNAVDIYNKINGTSRSKHNFDGYDFPSFEYAVRIYERVAVREDVAIVSSRNCVNGSNFDTNIRKLMGMLYYVNWDDEGAYKGCTCGACSGSFNKHGSGRLMFTDYMKRYVDEAGTHKTINPKTGQEMSYYELRNLPGGDKYKANMLRNGFMSDGTFMHKTHPLVKYANDSITGWHLNDEHNLVADKGKPDSKKNYMNRRTAKRNDEDMFKNDGDSRGLTPWSSHDEKEFYGEKEGEYYYLPTDQYYGVAGIPWSASERERQEMTEYEADYAPYRWRMPLYESKSNTTDYIYIDDNGNFVRDDKYSGLWYGIDALTSNGNVWEYKVVKWNKIEPQSRWPWNISNGDCLTDWWLGDGTTWVPGNSNGKHIHLYYDYYDKGYNGRYRALTTAEPGTYKNQSMEKENDLFKGKLIENAIEGRPNDSEHRRENDVERTVDSDEETQINYYVSMNIINGDGFNKDKSGTTENNKVLYYNSYEVTASNKPNIPIDFIVKTSAPISKIELLQKDNRNPTAPPTQKVLYTALASNDLTTTDVSKKMNFTGGAAGLSLTRDRSGDNPTTHKPTLFTGPEANHTYVYTFTGKITSNDLKFDYYKKGSNNTFYLKVYIKPTDDTEVSAQDAITIAVRDFYELN